MSLLLETSNMSNISHIYVGDFNIHLNNVDNPGTCTFSELLECFVFTNHENIAAHSSDNTLDLVISGDRNVIQHVD